MLTFKNTCDLFKYFMWYILSKQLKYLVEASKSVYHTVSAFCSEILYSLSPKSNARTYYLLTPPHKLINFSYPLKSVQSNPVKSFKENFMSTALSS